MLLALALATTPAFAELDLPTPLEHCETYDLERAGRDLFFQMMVEAPAEERALVVGLLEKATTGDRPLAAGEVRAVVESVEWERWRPQVLELLLHASRVLEVVPDSYRRWLPVIHDSLLLFLDGLDKERFEQRLVEQLSLPRDASRGERMLAFIARTPSLQKMAQIIARHDAIASDTRQALQTVENGLATVRDEEIRAQVQADLGEETIERFQLELAGHVLAEASVGAVLPVSFVPPGTDERQEAACKVLKPYAIAAMEEDLEIIDAVLAFLEEHGRFYDLGETPLVQMFGEIRKALSREVRVESERDNLLRAGDYYRDDPRVVVPEVYPFSTANVTCMEFIHGRKITDAFQGQPRERAELARRLSDALTFDVIFSPREEALFHGDPHAGNVFHVEDGGEDPYRIALLDWGLCATFSREEREKLVQMLLGLHLRDGKRLGSHIDAILDWEPQTPNERQAMEDKVEGIVAESQAEGWFGVLNDVITRLAAEGYAIRYEAAIFIKSQLTIHGLLKELDPSFEQDEYLMSRISGQVWKELHVRLLKTIYFPAWNSHGYRSMLSNEDVKDVQLRKCGRGLKSLARGIWHVISFGWLRPSGDTSPPS